MPSVLNFSARRMYIPELPETLLEALDKLVELDAARIPSGEDSSLYIRPYMFAMDSFIGCHPLNPIVL